MCYQCFLDSGHERVDNEEVRLVAKLVSEFEGKYDAFRLHFIIEDWNLETEWLEEIIANMKKEEDIEDQELFDAELSLAQTLLSLTEQERYSVMCKVEGHA